MSPPPPQTFTKDDCPSRQLACRYQLLLQVAWQGCQQQGRRSQIHALPYPRPIVGTILRHLDGQTLQWSSFKPLMIPTKNHLHHLIPPFQSSRRHVTKQWPDLSKPIPTNQPRVLASMLRKWWKPDTRRPQRIHPLSNTELAPS